MFGTGEKPVLEAGDLNDSAILASTTQTRGANGSVQFAIVLPGGRRMVSEWVAEDKLKDALQTWLGTVRAQAVEAAREERIARGRAAMLAQTGQEKSSANGTPNTAPADVAYTASRAAQVGADPLEYARHQLSGYARKVEELKQQIAVLTAELDRATRLQGRWFTVVSSLTESENV
jgi:hypothetical protein